MTEATPWRTLHTAIVLDCSTPHNPRVLVTPVGDDPAREVWALPEWTVDEPPDGDPLLDRTVTQVRERLGMDAALLRYLEPHEDEAARRRSGTWVMERRAGGAETQPGSRWVTREALESLADPDDRLRLALTVLRELEDGSTPPGRCTWSEPGWLAVAERWMTERLRELDRSPVGAIEQVRNNSISSVLRAHTATGDVYLKAASRHFRTEARVTLGLAERFPEHLPCVLASDVERSWLLMEDFGSNLRNTTLALWEETLRIVGELQRRCVGEDAWLRSIGCADRRLTALREQIPGLVEAPETRAELEDGLHARLVAHVPELQAACDELASLGVPETLIHGDLHGGNVAHKDGYLTVFDWTDAAVAHPFLDLVTFLPTERRKPKDVDDAKQAARYLRDAYLEVWTGHVSAAQLERGVELLKTVGQLHHAHSYLQILRSLEPSDYWQWEGELGKWLTPLAAPGTEMEDFLPG